MPPKDTNFTTDQAAADALCAALLRELGGARNIERLSHCTTRLRVHVSQKSLVNLAALKAHAAVLNVITQGHELQLIIKGPVDLLCLALQQVVGSEVSSPVLTKSELLEVPQQGNEADLGLPVSAQPNPRSAEAVRLPNGSIGSLIATGCAKLTSLIAAAILPLIGFLTATASLSALTGLLVFTGLLDPSDRLFSFLNSCFLLLMDFLPVLVGYNCSKWLKSSPMVSIVLGLCLVPTFYRMLCAIMPGYDTITVPLLLWLQDLVSARFDFARYTVSVLPILAAAVLNAKLERLVVRVISSSVQPLVLPFICLCFCLPLVVLFIAPLFTALGYVISGGLLSLYEHSPWLLGLVMGFCWELLVLLGLHWVFSPVMLTNLSILGYDMTIAMVMATTAATAGAMLGQYLTLRCRKHQESVSSEELIYARNASVLAVVFGITEPALYRYLLPKSRLLLIVCLIGGVGGLLIAMAGVHMYSISLSSTFAFVLAYRPNASASLVPLWCFIAVVVSCFSLALAVSFMWRGPSKPQVGALAGLDRGVSISAVAAGKFVPLTEVNDQIFSSLMLGDGYALDPEGDVLVAPCDGTLSSDIVFAHAVGLKGPLESEILLHVGINTVRLEGKYFKLLKEPGAKVTRGEPLMQFDRAQIVAAGFDPTVLVICTLPERVHLTHNEQVAAGDQVHQGQSLLTLSGA